MAKRQSSDGTLGEQLAQHWFNSRGWHMTRIQPPVRYIWKNNVPTIIPVGKKGDPKPPDYVGWRMMTGSPPFDDVKIEQIVWCEVKEAHGDTMPASRLDKEQRAFLKMQPQGTAWVLVVWVDGNPETQAFPFIEIGSYKRKL